MTVEAPRPALGDVAGVAQTLHQLRPRLRDAAGVPADLGPLTGEVMMAGWRSCDGTARRAPLCLYELNYQVASWRGRLLACRSLLKRAVECLVPGQIFLGCYGMT
jgi:hypothetical protein